MYSAQNGLNNGNYHGSFVVAEKAVIWNVTKPYSQGFLNTLIFKISRKLHHYGLVSAIPIMKFLVTQKEAFISPNLEGCVFFPTCYYKGQHEQRPPQEQDQWLTVRQRPSCSKISIKTSIGKLPRLSILELDHWKDFKRQVDIFSCALTHPTLDNLSSG